MRFHESSCSRTSFKLHQVDPRRSSLSAALLVVVVAALIQAGSALAVLVIAGVGVVEALWLRTAFAGLILAAVRPRSLYLPPRRHWVLLAGLVVSLVSMNFSFYQAIDRGPVGVVVAVEFIGPLGVALAGSRRWTDFLWAVLAAVGVGLLARPGGGMSLASLLFALLAAGCWASFIVLAKRAVTYLEPFRVTTLMLLGAAVLVTPVWLATGVRLVGYCRPVLLGLGVAILSSAAPYFLELTAIKRVKASTYGVLLSIEPAIAALMGFLILGQRLIYREIAGMAAVVVAAAGASWITGSGERKEQVGHDETSVQRHDEGNLR